MCKIKVKKNFKNNFEKKMKLQDYNAQELLKGRRFIWIKCLQHRVFLYPSSFPTTLSPSPSGSSSVQFIDGINHARLLVWVSSGSLFITRKSLQPLMHQSIPPAPSPPPPGLLGGIYPPCQSRGWGICKFCTARGPGICQPPGHSRAFDTHAVSYQNITTQKVLLEKKSWLAHLSRTGINCRRL